MMTSRRSVLKMGVALSAVPLIGGLNSAPQGKKLFSTGIPDLDRDLGGGIHPGSFVAVIGPHRSGKTAFLLRLAKANGIADPHAMNTGASDMLSIMERADGKYVGSLMLDAAEPATDQERRDMDQSPNARHAFLTRWFRRTWEVVQESGGLFAISAWGTSEDCATAPWMSFPDYVIRAQDSTYGIIKWPVPRPSSPV
jgi:hypothetical protein